MKKNNDKLIGIEVKASSSVNNYDFNALRILQEAVGSDFMHGVILYLGKDVISFGKKLTAIPITVQLGL